MDLATIQDHSGVLEDLDLNVNNLAGYAQDYEQEEEEEENPVIYESKVSFQPLNPIFTANQWSFLTKIQVDPIPNGNNPVYGIQDSEGHSAPSASDELSVEHSSDSRDLPYEQKPMLSLEPQHASVPSLPSSMPSTNEACANYDEENNVYDTCIKTYHEEIITEDPQSYELAPIDNQNRKRVKNF